MEQPNADYLNLLNLNQTIKIRCKLVKCLVRTNENPFDDIQAIFKEWENTNEIMKPYNDDTSDFRLKKSEDHWEIIEITRKDFGHSIKLSNGKFICHNENGRLGLDLKERIIQLDQDWNDKMNMVVYKFKNPDKLRMTGVKSHYKVSSNGHVYKHSSLAVDWHFALKFKKSELEKATLSSSKL